MSLLRKALEICLDGQNMTASIRQQDIPQGTFGAIAPYFCDGFVSRRDVHFPCGPVWEEPETICTYKGCGFESFDGPEPDEYESVCPNCGGYDVGEYTNPPLSFKVTNRRKATINHRRAA